MEKKLNIIIPLNYDLCQVMTGFFIKKLKKDSIEKKSTNICQKFLFEDTNKQLHFSINFLANEDFESFIKSGGETAHPKLKLAKNNIDFLSIFESELFSKENNILYSSDWFLEKNPLSFFEELRNKLVYELELDVNITIVFEDFSDLIRHRFLSAFKSFYTGFSFSHINEFASFYEIPKIERAIKSIEKVVSLFGREKINFVYQKRDLFRDNFPKHSWENILNFLQLEESDFTDDFLSIDIKKTALVIHPLFCEYYRSVFERRRYDSNFRQIMIGEIQKINQLVDFYKIPLPDEKLHFSPINSENIIALNSKFEKLTKLPFLSKRILIKSKKTNQVRVFNYTTS